ncbi:tetratricopeptide repeat protein [Marinomonas sp.]
MIKSSMVSLLSLIALLGCGTTSEKTPTDSLASTPSSNEANQPTQHLEDLLSAEFTLQRAGADVAYPQFYKLALQSKDLELTQRLTEIALATRNTSHIVDSTGLWLAIDPQASEAYAIKMQALLKAHQPTATANMLINALDNQASLEFLPVFLEKNLNENSLISTLTDALELLPDLQPQNKYVQLTRARIHYLDGQYPQAITITNQLLKKYQYRDENTFLILAYSQEKMGNLKAAIKALQASLNKHPDSIDTLTPLLEFLVQGKEQDTAYKTYQDYKVSSTYKFPLAISFSSVLLKYEHPDLALKVLEELPDTEQRLAEQVTYLAAQALARLDRKAEAIQKMEAVEGVLRSSATNQMAVWLYDEAREEEINTMILRRLQRESAPEEIANISQLHQEKGKSQLSLELLTRALNSYPESNMLRYQKALLCDSLDLWQDAITEFETLLSKDPHNPQYLNALGYTLLIRTPNLKEAMGYIELAYEQSNNDPAIIDSLGWGFFLMNELEQAAYYLKKAWSILPDPEIAAHYGESLWKQKNYQQAISVWQAALKESPDSDLLLNTINRLSPTLIQFASQPSANTPEQ